MTWPRRFRIGSSNYETVFDYAAKQQRISEIEREMATPGFWDNQEKAQAVVTELKSLKALLKPLDEATQREVLQGLYERGYRSRRLKETCRKLEIDERLVDEMWPPKAKGSG